MTEPSSPESGPVDPSRKGVPKVVTLEVVDEIPEGGGIPRGGGRMGQGSEKTSKQGRFAHFIRFALSLAVAAAADGLEVVFPPAWVVIDLATAGVFLLLWGIRWEVAIVLIPELIPGVAIFPSWTLLALFLGGRGTDKG